MWFAIFVTFVTVDEVTEDAARDDAIFGETVPQPVEESSSQSKLDLGGFLYLRLDGAGQKGDTARELGVSAPGLLDIFIDARPNTVVRAYGKGRLRQRFGQFADVASPFSAPSEATTADLQQLWLNLNVDDVAYVTIGRQPLKWGSARFWNPTDVLHAQTRDPLALFDERAGLDLVKLHVPIESLGWNFYAVLNLDAAAGGGDGGESAEFTSTDPSTSSGRAGAGRIAPSGLKDAAGALRAELLLGAAEVSLTAAARNAGQKTVGADVSFGLWQFDFRAEAAMTHDPEKLFYRVNELPAPWAQAPFAIGEGHHRDDWDDWIGRVALGGDLSLRYSDEDSVIVGGEYFFNDGGYKDAKLYSWLLMRGAFNPLTVGRQYLAGYAVLTAPGSWNDSTFVLSALANLSDESFVSRLDASTTILTHVQLSAYVSYAGGERGSFYFGLDVPAISSAQQESLRQAGIEIPEEAAGILQSGLHLAPTVLSAGVGLRVRF